MKFKILIPISLFVIMFISLTLTGCFHPRMPGSYETKLNLQIIDTNSLSSDDALKVIIADGIMEKQDLNTIFNKDRTGYTTTQLLGSPDTIHFDWNYHHSETVQLLFEDSSELILEYYVKDKCWKTDYVIDSNVLMSFTFKQL